MGWPLAPVSETFDVLLPISARWRGRLAQHELGRQQHMARRAGGAPGNAIQQQSRSNAANLALIPAIDADWRIVKLRQAGITSPQHRHVARNRETFEAD